MDDNQKPMKEKDNHVKHSIKQEHISGPVPLRVWRGLAHMEQGQMLKTSSVGPVRAYLHTPPCAGTAHRKKKAQVMGPWK